MTIIPVQNRCIPSLWAGRGEGGKGTFPIYVAGGRGVDLRVGLKRLCAGRPVSERGRDFIWRKTLPSTWAFPGTGEKVVWWCTRTIS